MAVFKKMFKKFLGFEEEYEEDNHFEQLNNQTAYYTVNDYETERKQNKDISRSNVKQIFKENESLFENQTSKEIILHPKTFADACDVVDHLEKGLIVVLNMEDVDIDTCKRIADFVLGAIYVLQGDVEKISKKTFRFWIK